MDKSKLLEVLHKLSIEYIEKIKSCEEIIMELATRININDIHNSDDELVIGGYYALKYLEDEYQTTDYEILYLIECFEGKRIFSQKDRNMFIGSKGTVLLLHDK